MTTEPTKPRWFIPTPGKLVLGLLIIEILLLLIKPTSGWMVLTGIAIFILTILVGLIWLVVALVLRRKFQFGISTVLLLMVCLAIVGGWFSWKMRAAKRQAEAVKAIRELDGVCDVHHDYRFGANDNLMPNPEPPGPAWLRELVGVDFFSNVVYISIFSDRVTNADLEHLKKHLKGLRNVKRLSLAATQISDEGLDHLRGLTGLKELHITN